MARPTKRERKFKASGGVKRRLERGTITNKGKLRKRTKRSNEGSTRASKSTADSSSSKSAAAADVASKHNRKNDFLGQENLGDLDIDSFFEKAVEAAALPSEDEEEQLENFDDEESSASEGNENEDSDKKDRALEPRSRMEEDDEESSSSSSEDSDDDVDAAEARMKAEMKKMQEADPEFHDFLKENEESLLEFGEDQDEDDNGEDENDEAEEGDKESKQIGQGQIHLTKKLLASIEKGVFKSHGIKSLKRLMAAYKSCCHLADASGANDSRPGESGGLYSIDSPTVFDELMTMCLSRCHEEFNHHLVGKRKESQERDQEDGDDGENHELDEDKPINPKTLENAELWADIRPIMLSFFRSTLHIMSEAKEPELLTFILKSLSKYLRFMTPFPRVAESMLKSLTSLWSAPLDTSEDYQVVRINAFFRIRQLALTQPFPFIEDCLKKTYLAYAKRAKFGTAASATSVLPTLTFMGNCLVELYSLDYHSSYQHAFVYIRQLALLLRSAMQKKTPEAMQQVYCWQYVHCLKLWVAVLAAAAPEDDGASMRSLIFPLTEVILGTIRFAPSPTRHLPLRFHCVRLLQQLASSTEVFIPTASLLLDCLDWKEWYVAPKKSKTGNARGTQMQFLLKLPKDDTLRTHEQLEMGMNELFLLLNREMELYRYSAGFPEFSIRILQRLRVFCKEQVRNPRWRTFAKTCIDTCERYAAWAVQARSKLQEAPKDVKVLECLRPVSEKNMRERHEESIQKEQKALEAARAGSNPNQKNSSKKSGGDQDDDNDEDKVDEEHKSKTKRKKKHGKKAKEKKEQVAKELSKDPTVLEQEDSVQEGIHWSDDED